MPRSRALPDALQDSEHRFRFFLDYSVDAIFIATGEGTIVAANQAWLNVFQHSRDELAGLNADDVYANSADRHELMRRVSESAHFRDEASYRRKDGTVFSAHLAAVALRDQAGAVRSYESIIYDVTSE